MRRPSRGSRVGAALLAALGAVVFAVPAIADDPTTGPVELDDVTLRWGLNNESSNRAFAPDTFNFFSAGTVPDPGGGGTTLPEARWKQASGHVSIEKSDGTTWQPATWAGLGTDTAGAPLGSPTAGTFSNHRFAFSAGTGSVDTAAGTAHVAWDGDVTVLYYSGMSFFTLSDPVLDVAGGRGTLTATLSGYASSVSDPSAWAPVPATQVTVADLPQVTLEAAGLTATPAYAGVTVTGVDQVTGAATSGSFPQSWVDFAGRLGTAAFWYSSGASTDAFKVPLPLSVAFGSADVETTPTPTATPSAAPSATPTKQAAANPVVPAPATTVTVTARPVTPVTPAAPPGSAPVAPAVPTASAAPVGLPAAAQLVAAPQTSVVPAERAPDPTWTWWLGGALLLVAALTLLVPVGRPRRP